MLSRTMKLWMILARNTLDANANKKFIDRNVFNILYTQKYINTPFFYYKYIYINIYTNTWRKEKKGEIIFLFIKINLTIFKYRRS